MGYLLKKVGFNGIFFQTKLALGEL